MNIVIGSTGFIGSSLLEEPFFTYGVNSSTISNIKDKLDTVVVAAPSGIKYLANKNPKEDAVKCSKLCSDIAKYIRCNKLVIVSTIDVFGDTTYGKNRLLVVNKLKEYCLSNNIDFYCMYLGMTFGKKAIKGMIYDFSKGITQFYLSGSYQLYPVNRLLKDIKYCISNNIHEAILASEPISSYEIAKAMGLSLEYKEGINYNIEPKGLKLIPKEEIIIDVKNYIK